MKWNRNPKVVMLLGLFLVTGAQAQTPQHKVAGAASPALTETGTKAGDRSSVITTMTVAIPAPADAARGMAFAASGSPERSTGQMRTYYIAADEVIWDYAPSGINHIVGQPFGDAESFWVASGPHQVGKVLKKALYREYTDATFTRLKPRPTEWEHLGFLGPLLRAEVGDTIQVTFKNNLHFPASMHPHGVLYRKDSEGAVYHDGTADASSQAVPPGATHTYTWPVPERAGPGAGDMSSVLWMYHSHVNEIADTNAGLVGPMIITARGMAKADGTPKDVDREFVIAFATVFESESPYLQENIQEYTGEPKSVKVVSTPTGARGIQTGNSAAPFDPLIREAINGFLFGNTPGLTMNVGDHVRWYLMATSNFELHAPHWHGNTVLVQNMRTDVATLLTMGMLVADMVPDNPGTWLFHCHVGGHLRAGMQALYTVEPEATPKRAGRHGS
ncbi:MAG TPA: multicopper oxidase domain-containing protein [Candidatus Acidoferrum sp.]